MRAEDNGGRIMFWVWFILALIQLLVYYILVKIEQLENLSGTAKLEERPETHEAMAEKELP